jgi:hypothetical protein
MTKQSLLWGLNMPRPLVEYELENGSKVLVEVSVDDVYGFKQAGIGDGIIPKASKKLEEALGNIPMLASAILKRVGDMTEKPKEITLDMGIKFGVKGDLIIAGGEAEANCTISIKWK